MPEEVRTRIKINPGRYYDEVLFEFSLEVEASMIDSVAELLREEIARAQRVVVKGVAHYCLVVEKDKSEILADCLRGLDFAKKFEGIGFFSMN